MDSKTNGVINILNPISRFETINGMELHFTEWGDRKNPTVVCWHGLTRNGRDFDILARHLAKNYHVICPDTIGRGFSQWSTNPEQDYCFENYVKIAIGLLDQLEIEQVRWVGTSMGGAIAMRLAGTPQHQNRITHLVLNDIGAGASENQPQDIEGIKRIISYVGAPPAFKTFTELKNYYKLIYNSFGVSSEEEWNDFTQNSCRRRDEGGISPDYDPKIALQFQHSEDLNLWNYWEAIQSKILLIRGEISDVLPLDVALKMKETQSFQMETIPKVGHAPALNTKEQISIVEKFLKEV
ncbi:alpha/beta fold hydrolase [Bacillus sp. AFS017336]|uniref:alpha/beta fold hydrolase n=1 Tax=Bacillus sp. AFS017336 TaxID=2033489 RepID=UPI000BF08A93|nr:alpha/beta hydrolase [Bacillus sp. AFS017336]PEL13934.1 alpha/beta hydrolase [Bacillus sp. AFS017336]